IQPPPAAHPGPPTMMTAPGAPRPGTAVPTIPTPPRPVARPTPGAAAPPPEGQIPGGGGIGGSPLRPPAKPNLVGQPAARPVVPPRADMVARLARPAMPSAPAPGAPRPGMPSARPASPVPGRPIYTG